VSPQLFQALLGPWSEKRPAVDARGLAANDVLERAGRIRAVAINKLASEVVDVFAEKRPDVRSGAFDGSLIRCIPSRPEFEAIEETNLVQCYRADEVLRRFPVEGNVICGGYEQNVYRAKWDLLNTGDAMRWEPPPNPERPWEKKSKERPKVEVDVADLVSEKANGYKFEQPQNGWTDMRVLPDPTDPQHDMFDAGRRIAAGKSESFDGRGLILGKPLHLVLRLAQESTTTIRVHIDGADAGAMTVHRTDAWEEKALAVDAKFVPSANVRVELTNEGPGDFVDFHAWITQ